MFFSTPMIGSLCNRKITINFEKNVFHPFHGKFYGNFTLFREEKEQFIDHFLSEEGDKKLLMEKIEKVRTKHERLRRYVSNIGKAQQATIKMAMEFIDLLRKVDSVSENLEKDWEAKKRFTKFLSHKKHFSLPKLF